MYSQSSQKPLWWMCFIVSSTCFSTAAEDPKTPDGTRADAVRQSISKNVASFARWTDAFFANPNYVLEERDSRLALRQLVVLTDKEGADYKARIRSKLSLPNLSSRLSLTFQGNAESVIDPNTPLEGGLQGAVDAPAIGIEYVDKRSRRVHRSVTGGIRLENPSVYLGPRIRAQQSFGAWLGRVTQRVIYDTEDTWELTARMEMDRSLETEGLFRASVRADWREDARYTDGVRYTVATSFFKQLGSKAATQYEWSSVYATQPRTRWLSHRLFAGYRRVFLRDWIALEAGVFVAFEDRFDWDANPGFQVGLDLVFEDDTISPPPQSD